MTARLISALALCWLIAAAVPATALGHAELVASDPADGATLATTPYTLTATFDEEIDADQSSIFVENAAGAEVARGAVSAADATTMTVELPSLAPGRYTVRWTSVTPDDQGVERGTFTFSVAAPSASGTPVATPVTTPVATPPPGSGTAGSSNEVILALALAAIGIGMVLAYVFLRSRR